MLKFSLGPKVRQPLHLHDKKLKELEKKASEIREDLVAMLVEAGSGHSAGPLGMADIFTALYFPVRVFWIMNHDMKIQCCENIRHPEWSCRVSASSTHQGRRRKTYDDAS